MTTTHILVKNNDDCIRQTLESLNECEILIGDLGCTDNTIKICKEFNCKIVPVKPPRNVARNNLLTISKTEWQFYLEPGEILSSGHELLYFLEGLPKRIYVASDDIITKELRLCKKNQCQFINPVFECLQPDEAEQINVFVSGVEPSNCLNELLIWKTDSPQSSEVDYYLSCQYLILKDYNKFISYADYFLFKENNPTYAAIMTRYYLSQIYLHVNKNVHEAVRNIIYCLTHKPLMAEFWCVLGDCYYRAGVPQKAMEFFRLAMEMGEGRLTNDPFPVELVKYKEYPEKMIKLCKSIIENTLF